MIKYLKRGRAIVKETTKLQFILSFTLLLITTAIFMAEFKRVEYLALYLVCVIVFTLVQLNIIRVFTFKSYDNLEDINDQLETIINSIPGFVSWVDKDLIYLGVNKNLSGFFDLKQSDFIGKKLGSVTPGEDELLVKQAQNLFKSDKENAQVETSFEYDGKTFWSLLTMRKYNNGANALLVSIDITKLKKTQIKIKNEETSAVQAGRLASVGEMMATITHEINNPLAVINSSNSIIQRQLENDQVDIERLRKIVKMNETAMVTIEKIIKSVKNLVRDGANDKPEDTYLFDILDDVLIFISKKCQDNHIVLNLDKPMNDIKLNCVPVQITQVLLILLNNAIDAVEKYEDKWIKLKVDKRPDDIIISVIDSGPGVEPKIAKKMFDSFYTTKKSGKGTGIGLGLARKIAKTHGGSLKLDKDFEFTKFDLIIPDIK